ncbi:MAG: alpha-glucan family phosphorylase [Deltaproteobacteria bacterium]|nr:alpha-glucan family phosphorylase [Deltaproteobacteria bacterium]
MSSLVRDPICGMPVERGAPMSATSGGERLYFCSELCRREFLARGAAPASEDARSARRIAYFSMEVAFDPTVPTYAGGLGVLAADALRSAADLRVPMLAVTLVHRRGYFGQRLGPEGQQIEARSAWRPESILASLGQVASIEIQGRQVHVGAWQYDVVGSGGYRVPIILLDTDLDGNDPQDREITAQLYGGDPQYRLTQELVLGLAGPRALRALGYSAIQKIHLNEGHAALAAVEMLREALRCGAGLSEALAGVRRRCVFTTHTPVAAGHDHFPRALVEEVAGPLLDADLLSMVGGDSELNLTELALNLSASVNGVARRHGETANAMFPGRDIGAITNGVHAATWTGPAFRALFDRFIPPWREDPSLLRQAMAIPAGEVWNAHAAEKRRLISVIAERTNRVLAAPCLIAGFARRATGYKRADLVFHDLEHLRELGRGHLALVFAGKAHPSDEEGKAIIRRIHRAAEALGGDVPVVYLAGYDAELAARLVAGVDLWLNTPLPPLEASGTSGMKAALNGVPSLSTLDGWWLEGCIEGVTGWSIGDVHPSGSREEIDRRDASLLYRKLELEIMPLFFGKRAHWLEVMRSAIALNGSFFHSHRMMQQYAAGAYLS